MYNIIIEINKFKLYENCNNYLLLVNDILKNGNKLNTHPNGDSFINKKR